MTPNKLKTVSPETMIDKHSGKPGTERRDAFENLLNYLALLEKLQVEYDPKYLFEWYD